MRMSTFTLRQPNQSSDFIGRKTELDDLTQRLQSDQCRLLTLIVLMLRASMSPLWDQMRC